MQCVYCGQCTAICPYEKLSYYLGLQGRMILYDIYKKGKVMSKRLLNYIASCIGCELCVNFCPLDINIIKILRSLYEKSDEYRRLINTLLKKKIILNVKTDHETIFLINKFYTPVNLNNYISQIKNLINSAIGKFDVVIFNDPIHLRYIYQHNFFKNVYEGELQKISKDQINRVIIFDEYTTYFFKKIIKSGEIEILSILDVIINLLENSTIIIQKSISGVGALVNPVYSAIQKEVSQKIFSLLSYLPDIIIIKDELFVPDLPNPFLSLSQEISLIKKYINKICNEIHFIITSSLYLTWLLSKVTKKYLFIPVYLPYLISQITKLLI